MGTGEQGLGTAAAAGGVRRVARSAPDPCSDRSTAADCSARPWGTTYPTSWHCMVRAVVTGTSTPCWAGAGPLDPHWPRWPWICPVSGRRRLLLPTGVRRSTPRPWPRCRRAAHPGGRPGALLRRREAVHWPAPGRTRCGAWSSPGRPCCLGRVVEATRWASGRPGCSIGWASSPTSGWRRSASVAGRPTTAPPRVRCARCWWRAVSSDDEAQLRGDHVSGGPGVGRRRPGRRPRCGGVRPVDVGPRRPDRVPWGWPPHPPHRSRGAGGPPSRGLLA